MIDLKIGLIGQSMKTVTQQETAKTLGSGSLDVLGTPAMLALMEAASVAAIDEALEQGYTTVGIEVNIRHLSATPIGETVVAMAELTEIDGKRLRFEVRAWDKTELIGEGTHMRYIIEVDRFMDRLTENQSISS